MYGEHGRFAYHYTTCSAAFEHILPSKKLRLSSLAQLRDPVENKDWVQAHLTSVSWPPEDVQRFREATDRVLHETKILSFTLDAPLTSQSPEHARGYARPRMWEQYAENHAGACLVFDRDLLRKALMSAPRGSKIRSVEKITYSDLPLHGHEGARTLIAGLLIQAGGGDLEVGLRRHLKMHAQELFFRKLEDWITEHEYRYLILHEDSVEAYAPFDDALRAVIVGERFPKWQIPGAAKACSATGTDLRQIKWGAFPPNVVDPAVPDPIQADLSVGRSTQVADPDAEHPLEASRGVDWAAMGSSGASLASGATVISGTARRKSAL
jgi:hypothetical protein